MDTRDGTIRTDAQVAALAEEDRRYHRLMAYQPTPRQRATGKVGRNDVCPCGSGRKFKRCCLWRLNKEAREAREAREAMLCGAPSPGPSPES